MKMYVNITAHGLCRFRVIEEGWNEDNDEVQYRGQYRLPKGIRTNSGKKWVDIDYWFTRWEIWTTLDEIDIADQERIKSNPLMAPANHPLDVLLSELKRGRMAEDQKLIDGFIIQLSNQSGPGLAFSPTQNVVSHERQIQLDREWMQEKMFAIGAFMESEEYENLNPPAMSILNIQASAIATYLQCLTEMTQWGTKKA